jgi:hypothetical protein
LSDNETQQKLDMAGFHNFNPAYKYSVSRTCEVHPGFVWSKGKGLSGAEKSVESQPEKTVTRENSI